MPSVSTAATIHITPMEPPQTLQPNASTHIAFQLVQKMCAIADKVAAAAPGTFVDFDVTERNRAMGLGFLASGRYSLMNSGPYTKNYDLTVPGPSGPSENMDHAQSPHAG
jgi:hypothetical protein